MESEIANGGKKKRRKSGRQMGDDPVEGYASESSYPSPVSSLTTELEAACFLCLMWHLGLWVFMCLKKNNCQVWFLCLCCCFFVSVADKPATYPGQRENKRISLLSQWLGSGHRQARLWQLANGWVYQFETYVCWPQMVFNEKIISLIKLS